MTKRILTLILLLAAPAWATELKQSTSYHRMIFMADSTDHVTGKAGLTLTITASKAGAAFSSTTPTVTDRGSGWYDLALTTTDTATLGDLCLHVTSTGADPSDLRDVVITWDKATALSSTTVGTVTTLTNDPSGTTTLLGRLTSTRAGLLDNLDATVSSRNATTPPTVAAIRTEMDSNSTKLASIDGKTTNLPAAPASTTNITAASGIALAASQHVIVDSGTVTTLTNLPSIPTNWLTATGIASAALNGKGDWNIGKTGYSIGTDGITDASFALGTGKKVVRSGTAQAGATTTITLDAGASATDDIYKDVLVYLTSGTGVGQSRVGKTYVGSTKVLTLDSAWVVPPDSSTTFALIPYGTFSTSSDVATAVWAAATRSLTDKAGYSLSQSFPTNFSSLAITGGGAVTVGTLPSIPSNWITAGGINAAALNGKGDWNIGKTGYSLATDVWDETLASHLTAGTTGAALNSAGSGGGPSAATIADAVWDEILSGHAISGSTGVALGAAGSAGDPWSIILPGAYAGGTAGKIIGNINPATVTLLSPIITGNNITERAGDTWSIPIQGLGDLNSVDKLWFSINTPSSPDSAAKIFLELTDGLTIVNGAVHSPSSDGSITISDADNGQIWVNIDEAVTAQLGGAQPLRWTIKKRISGTDTTLATGLFTISKAGIGAIQ